MGLVWIANYPLECIQIFIPLMVGTIVCGLAGMTGCSLFTSDSPEPFELESFEITTELNANADSPTRIDVVRVDHQLK